MSVNVLLRGSQHWITGTNRVKYTFPQPISLKGQEVSLTSCSMYNSFFNCSAALGTNTLQLKFPTSWSGTTATYTTYTMTIQDSFMTWDTLNYAIQSFQISRGLYMKNNTTNQNVYFVSLVSNTPLYAVQLNTYFLPTAAQATTLNWSLPAGSPIALATSTTIRAPQWIIPSGFGRVIGFSAANYPTTAASATGQTSSTYSSSPSSSSLSDLCPQINSVSAIIVRCNLIQNDMAIPNDLMQLMPLTSAYGALNQFSNPSESSYSAIMNNSAFSFIELQFFDQDLSPLSIKDPQFAITLNIRKLPA